MAEEIKKAVVDYISLLRISQDIIETVLKKNVDYGDAWQSQGIFTALIRLKDKLIRVDTLKDGRQALIADENIEDTLRDIVGYGLLGLLRLNWEQEHKDDLPRQLTIDEVIKRID